MRRYAKGRIARVVGTLALAAGGVLTQGCDGSTGAGPEPGPGPGVVAFMSGAPTGLAWGDPVTVRAFYPGQRSWQWIVGEVAQPTGLRTHPGWDGYGRSVGMACAACHAGKEAALGAALVLSDPVPVPGKVGHKDIEVRAAYDARNFYLRVRWESARPGITHQTYRYDGTNWVPNSKNRPAELGPGEHFSYEDRFAVMLSDRNLRADPALAESIGFETVGCWLTCHVNMRDMPQHPDRAGAQAFIGQDDVRKYLLATRNAASPESPAALAQMRADGEFLDLWQFRAARGAAVHTASDDYVLEYRLGDVGGTSAFFDQLPGDLRWMYDRARVGSNAIPMADYERRIAETPLITDGPYKNAVPYDPAAGFAEGDILPRRVLRQASGNRGDVRVHSEWKDGFWTVIFERALVTANTGGPNSTDKALDLASGAVYTLGLAIFDDHVTSRRHFVTFPLTLGGATTTATLRARAN